MKIEAFLRIDSRIAGPSKCSLFQESGKRKAHKLKQNPRDTGRVSWDTRRDKQGSTGRCPRDFLLIAIEKRTEKGVFAGTPAGCPKDTRPSRGFSEILCDFFLCAFSAPWGRDGNRSLKTVKPLRRYPVSGWGAIRGPMPVSGETFRELSRPLAHTVWHKIITYEKYF